MEPKELLARIEAQAAEIAILKAAMRRAVPFIGSTFAASEGIVNECERLCEYGKFCEESGN